MNDIKILIAQFIEKAEHQAGRLLTEEEKSLASLAYVTGAQMAMREVLKNFDGLLK
ncbi:MAG: hypothetical protein AAB815_01780 [Patescibacteria group bacterium]